MNSLKQGDKVVFCRGKKNKLLEDVTIGKIYTIIEDELSDVFFVDDVGSRNFSAMPDGDGKATKIID